ncbi:ABC transporter substrate-binding protein [Vibrio furnissii]|uniref:ABC transporter substrate-binding protein n=1 Tax=Vibrio furnissii TaxID=29494 RepID=UPI0001B91ACE|nr:ABC transporter substrate-binding protein [Vibrio furnissii]EEX41446.1 ABC transporter substrate-binding protein YnjB [Vibrio furnissii CIP 102972]QDC93287.1 ABC transporter substrate-binding protein [Vibrio furnissii]UON48087.1 ABC transporter substrate-binding protein [Vibrio furnissii]SUP45715.1 ABC transporter substrate-binding protein [Vibrio furnissii]
MKKLLTLFSACVLSLSASAQSWQDISDKARGQTVYFHAWGGSQEINQYIRWAGEQLKTQYGVELKQVKITDTAETVTRLIAEKAAGKESGGSVDLMWINGENFKSMKNNDLLYGPFVETLPNWQYINASLPIDSDFSEPTDGLEAPWGVGQLVFIYDHQKLNNPPQSFAELLSYAKAFPNRITYPRPPEFHGTSFLKALLIELTNNDAALSKPVDAQSFALITAPLWHYLDELHAVAWRAGKQFPSGSSEMIQLLDDDQIDLALTFNPNAVYSAQASGKLAKTTRSHAMQAGALSNIHFLAIPWNATAKEGALVAINFLMSPEAQSRKGDMNVWGDPSVLRNDVLTGSAANTKLFKSIAEPHPSWQAALEAAWQTRYGAAK